MRVALQDLADVGIREKPVLCEMDALVTSKPLKRKKRGNHELQMKLILRRRIVEASDDAVFELLEVELVTVSEELAAVRPELLLHHSPALVEHCVDELQSASGLRKQCDPVWDVRSGGDDVEMNGSEGKQVIQHDEVFALLSQGNGEGKRAFSDAEDERGEDVVGEGDVDLGKVCTAGVAVGESERVGFGALRAFANLVAKLNLEIFILTSKGHGVAFKRTRRVLRKCVDVNKMISFSLCSCKPIDFVILEQTTRNK